MNAAVWVNGRFIGDGGRFAEPVARNSNRPLIFPVPADAVVSDRNTLAIRVAADRAGAGVLGPVHVGRRTPLQAAAATRRLFKVECLRAIAVCQVMVVLFVFALWRQRRHETVYMWAALASLAWTLTWPNILVVDIPVPAIVWYWLFFVAAGWFTMLAARFVIDFIGESSPRTDRWLLGYGVIGSAALAVLAVLDEAWFFRAAVWAWIPVAFAMPAYSSMRFLLALGRDLDNVEYQVCHSAGIAIVGCGLHDWLVVAGFLPALEGFYSPYPAPFAQLAIGMILVRRFAGALAASEALVESLEEKVRAKRTELQAGYERLRAIDRGRVLSDERQRIMRDVQDGLGSHLVSTLALAERADPDRRAIAATVRSALDDLRLMIDSLAPVEGEIVPVLAQLRARLQARLDAARVRVEWRVEEVESIPDLGPHRVLQVLRILHEAIAGILGRAGVAILTVRTGSAPGPAARAGVFVEVSGDGREGGDGRGAPDHAMERRAAAIGALLETEAGPAGVRHRLWLPIVSGPS
jgi:signal transduction histidine kinase